MRQPFLHQQQNKSDSVTGNHNLYHSDFEEYFNVPNSHYSIDLDNAIRELNLEFIEDLFLEQGDYFEEPRYFDLLYALMPSPVLMDQTYKKLGSKKAIK